MKISRINCFEVVVPARSGAIESAGMNKPLHKLESGARPAWTLQFDEVPKLILRLELESGIIGWGELYRAHDWAVVDEIAQLLVGMDINHIVLQKLPFSFCREYDGFECAVWDAYARLHQIRVVDLLGGPLRDKIKVGAWSSHRSADDIETLVSRFAAQGYDCVKFKCDLDDDVVGWSRIVHDVVPQMKIILDPNERWGTVTEVKKRLAPLAEAGNILCIEDPVSRWKLHDYHHLRQFSPIAIVLHISLPYIRHGQRIREAVQAIREDAVDGFNFNCGLADFQLLTHIAEAAELPCWHGSEIDLGILEAMYLHSSAAASTCTWPGDIFGRLIREHDLLKKPLRIEPPYAYLPDGPGLGIEVDEGAIKNYLIQEKEYHK